MTSHGPGDSHEWVIHRNDDGDLYEVCTACGQQAHWTPLPPAVKKEAGLPHTA